MNQGKSTGRFRVTPLLLGCRWVAGRLRKEEEQRRQRVLAVLEVQHQRHGASSALRALGLGSSDVPRLRAIYFPALALLSARLGVLDLGGPGRAGFQAGQPAVPNRWILGYC